MKKAYTIMAMMGAMMSEISFPHENKGREFIPKKPQEPKQQKNTFQYWFRADGTFLNENNSIPMRKEECVFKCYAMNNKSAIKQFNKSKQ